MADDGPFTRISVLFFLLLFSSYECLLWSLSIGITLQNGSRFYLEVKTGLKRSFYKPKRKKESPSSADVNLMCKSEREQDEGGDCCIEMPFNDSSARISSGCGRWTTLCDTRLAMWNKSIIGWWIWCFGAYQTHSMDLRLVFPPRVMSVVQHSLGRVSSSRRPLFDEENHVFDGCRRPRIEKSPIKTLLLFCPLPSIDRSDSRRFTSTEWWTGITLHWLSLHWDAFQRLLQINAWNLKH